MTSELQNSTAAQSERNRIFTYWQNPVNGDIPPYIQLCLQTWFNNIPDLELIILNQSNLSEWVDLDFDMRVFSVLSPAAQSDIASFAVLAKHGGVFMDVDTIVTKNIFDEINKLEEDRDSVFFFYDKATGGPYMAFISCFERENPFLRACAAEESALLNEILMTRPQIKWRTFGNDILDAVRLDASLDALVREIDCTATGTILESCFFNSGDASQDYFDMFFSKNNLDFEEVVAKIEFGLVMLHNSWTPKDFKVLDLGAVINSDLIISQLLIYALGEDFFE
ncbi:MAG: capsular polysaccharide synthesis protein [Oscillospiraceae bacterium]|jgi:hypothetical protein|nr:capsular polysaccharide synthesis protein [Oscillospiraceae bacterium]